MQATYSAGIDAVRHVLSGAHIRRDRLSKTGDRRRPEPAELHSVSFDQAVSRNAKVKLLPKGAVRQNDKGTGPAVRANHRLLAKAGSIRLAEFSQQSDTVRAQLFGVPVVPSQ